MGYLGSGEEWWVEGEEVRTKFSVADVYYDSWVKLQERYDLFRGRMICQQRAHPGSQKYVALYRNQEDKLPNWLVSAIYFELYRFGLVQFSVAFMGTFPKYIVGRLYP